MPLDCRQIRQLAYWVAFSSDKAFVMLCTRYCCNC